MTPSDYFDFGVLLFIGFGTLWGFIRGFVSALKYVLIPFLGAMVAYRFHENLIQTFGWASTVPMKWIAGVALFLLTALVITILVSLMEACLKKSHLTLWNHLFGLVFGFLLALVVTWLVSFGMITFADSTVPMVAQSRSAKYLLKIAEAGKKRLPEPSDAKTETSKKVYEMSEKFIQRVEENRAAAPGEETRDENTGIPKMLDEVDSRLEPIFLRDEKNKSETN
ncbi:MAG: CvpA family protein [Thermoguttaceae bacterium]|nr:CvpA family protein [Thermoguttaceae bacterium]